MTNETTTHTTDRVPRLAAAVNVFAVIIGLSCIVINAIDVESPVRVFLAVLLFTLAPGSGIVQFLKVREPALQLGLIFALSIAIDLILAQTFLSFNSIGGLSGSIVLTALALIRPYGIPKRPAIDLEEAA